MDKVIAGKYRVIELINSGGQGKVFKVIDIVLEKIYAAKELKDIDGEKLRIIKGLKHEGFPDVVDIVMDDKSYIIMTYIDGINLDEYLYNNCLSLNDKLQVSIKICSLLAYLHNQPNPVCYIDCKPSNIMIDADASVWIVDFDSCLIKGNSNKTIESTRAYAAPELADGIYDTRSDVYSFGILMIHILLNIDVKYINNKEFKLDNYSINKDIKKLLSKAVSYDMDQRITDCSILLAELEKLNTFHNIRTVILNIVDYTLLVLGTAFVSFYLTSSCRNIDVNICIIILGIVFLLGKSLLDKSNILQSDQITIIKKTELSDMESDKLLYNRMKKYL